MKKILYLMAFICVFTITSVPVNAEDNHYESGRGSVNGDDHIRWGTAKGETKYVNTRDYAIDEWNSIAGLPNIYGDTVTVIETLSFDDYYEESGVLGYWQPALGADIIRLNTYNLDNYSGSLIGIRRKVFMHELGHALTMSHHMWYSGTQLMDQGAFSMNSIDSHTKSDFIAKWQ